MGAQPVRWLVPNVLQNTEEWYRERLGKPTASSFDKIINPSGKQSGQWYNYMFKLVYERICKKPLNIPIPSYWVHRGKALESMAAKAYEELTGYRTYLGGFILTEDKKIGCSPDRIVGNGEWDHALEIKVPTPWQHIQYTILGPGKDYRAQLQGQMYVGEFAKVDFFSFNPGMPCFVHTVERDEDYIKEMHKLLQKFIKQLDHIEEQARLLGNYDLAEMRRAIEEQAGDNPVDDGAGD